MDIKDSYLHGTVGVVKSISVSADKLKYKLADIAGTVKEVTLPVATLTANGLMSSGDKTKLDNLSSTIGNYVTLNTDQDITGIKTFTKQLKFTVADGTAPFTVTSTTKVPNLNADLLDGFGESAFLKDRGIIKADTIETTLTNGVYYTSEFCPPDAGYNYGSVLNFRSYPTLTLFYISDGAQTKPRIWYRNKWNAKTIINTSWLEFLTSNSYTNYTVGKDGTGATGTWGINVTGNAATADKLKTKRKLWGLDFDGTADVSGNMTGVGVINKVFKVTSTQDIAQLNVSEESSTVNYSHLYVSSNNTSNTNSRPLVLQYGYGNVGIGIIAPTQKLEVNGNVKATSFIGNLDGTYVNKLTGYQIATARGAVAATDSLNTALGKLEYKAYLGETAYDLVKGAYDGDGTIENLAEILKVLEGIKDTDTIQAIIGKYLPLTGGKLNSGTDTPLVILGTDHSWIGFKNSSGTDLGWIGVLKSKLPSFYSDKNYKIWHEGNDGTGSGLDADLLDGKHASAFALSSALDNYVTLNTDQVISGKKLFNNQLIIRKDVGDTGASVTDQQHNLLLQVMRYSDTHSVAIGVMPTGSGVIWAKANGIGYNTLYLNPHSKGVAIGCGNNTLPDLNDGYYFHIFGSTISNDNITANKFIKSGGTSTQFLKADGSVDSNKYLIVGSSSYSTSYTRNININGYDWTFWSPVNSVSSGTVYGPTTAGTQGLVLTSNGSGAPIWSNSVSTANKLNSAEAVSAKAFSLSNASWTDTGYTFASLATGTYAVQVTSGTNLVASGLMSVYKNLSDTAGDEIPLHVYGTAGWRPYLRTYANKLLISSNDTSSTKRTVTIKIALIL